MSTCENVLLQETNKGDYKLEILAKFKEPYPVKYVIRVTNPQGVKTDYLSTLDGFKNFGELLVALHYFAKTKRYPKDTEKLKEALTAENIKNFAKVLKFSV